MAISRPTANSDAADLEAFVARYASQFELRGEGGQSPSSSSGLNTDSVLADDIQESVEPARQDGLSGDSDLRDDIQGGSGSSDEDGGLSRDSDISDDIGRS